MEQKILKQIREASDSSCLCIENHFLFQIPDSIQREIQSLPQLKTLSFANCKLKSLENLPELENLKELNLNDNKIEDAQLPHILKFKKLKYLQLAGNLIEE